MRNRRDIVIVSLDCCFFRFRFRFCLCGSVFVSVSVDVFVSVPGSTHPARSENERRAHLSSGPKAKYENGNKTLEPIDIAQTDASTASFAVAFAFAFPSLVFLTLPSDRTETDSICLYSARMSATAASGQPSIREGGTYVYVRA